MELIKISLNDEIATRLINEKDDLDERIEKVKEIQDSMLREIEDMECDEDPRFDALDQDLSWIGDYLIELRAVESYWKALQANSDFRPCHFPGPLARVQGEQRDSDGDANVFDVLVEADNYESAKKAADEFLRYSSDANICYQCSDCTEIIVTLYN